MKNLATELENKATPFFTKYGFKPLPELRQFRREFAHGFQCVIFSTTSYPDSLVFEVHLGLRLDQVEALAFPYTNGLTGFQPDSMTLVTSVAKLKGKRFERHTLTNSEEASQVLLETISFLEQGGLTFLEDHSELRVMDELFNANPMRSLTLVHNQVNRCLRGITLAYLQGRSDVRQIERIYRQQLKIMGVPEFTALKYEELVKFLKTYSTN